MHKKLLFALIGWLLVSKALAQDPQFSQFYAAPLYLNPAFAGSTNASRAILNYRNQWPNLDANFVTYVASFDHFFRKYNSGVGVMGFFDKEGMAGFKSYTIALQYAYELNISKALTFRPGLQIAYSNRNVNSAGLIFPGELNDDGEVVNGDFHEYINQGTSYFDVSAGGVLYSRNYWIGFSAHHINQPTQRFTEISSSSLDRKYSIHAGYKIPLNLSQYPKKFRSGQRQKSGYNDNKKDISITPAVNFKNQGPFNQLDAGLYFTYSPMTFGAWYRGLPVPGFNKGKSINQDALIFLLGFQVMDLHIGYSYDYTVSKLGASTGGAHEISLVYDFYLGYRNQKAKRPSKMERKMPCPDF